MLEDTATPAVVLGCFRHGGLGIARSLGRIGAPVYVVDSDRYTPAFFSRYCRGKFLWDLSSASAEASVLFLKNLGEKIGRRSVLIPTSDIGAMLVSEHANQLRGQFIFPDQNPGLVRSLCSKRSMYHLARKHGVPTPETAFPQSRSDVIEYINRAKFPILLKAVYGTLYDQTGKQMILVNTEGELLEKYDKIEDPSQPNLILQEYIDSSEAAWVFNGYFDKNGKCRMAFTGKKLRNYPPYFGHGCLAICEENEEVKVMTIGFMEAIGYKGPLDIGYRYDARDGKYKVFDVNPRIGAMFRLFVGENGVDVSRAIYWDMVGRPIELSRIKEGRKWILEDEDLISSARHYIDNKLTIKEWISSLSGIDEATYIVLDDPWPAVGACLSTIRRRVSGRSARGKRDPT